MSWFLHNALADLPGPLFLLLYSTVIAAIVAASVLSLKQADRSLELGPELIPAKPDPCATAYLRGGAKELTRVLVASLVHRDLLEIAEDDTSRGSPKLIARALHRPSGALSALERTVLEWPQLPCAPRALFQRNGLAAHLRKQCAPYEERLTERALLTPPALHRLAVAQWLLGALLIFAVGGYKLSVALAKGHTNVGFLAAEAVVGVSVLGAACGLSVPRISRRGKAYLEQLQLAFAGLRDRIVVGEAARVPVGAGWTGSSARAGNAEWLLVLGAFGLSALDDTLLAELNALFARQSSASGCGGGCGSSGCGGCGCGGGGCGGGCGGCGG